MDFFGGGTGRLLLTDVFRLAVLLMEQGGMGVECL